MIVNREEQLKLLDSAIEGGYEALKFLARQTFRDFYEDVVNDAYCELKELVIKGKLEIPNKGTAFGYLTQKIRWISMRGNKTYEIRYFNHSKLFDRASENRLQELETSDLQDQWEKLNLLEFIDNNLGLVFKGKKDRDIITTYFKLRNKYAYSSSIKRRHIPKEVKLTAKEKGVSEEKVIRLVNSVIARLRYRLKQRYVGV